MKIYMIIYILYNSFYFLPTSFNGRILKKKKTMKLCSSLSQKMAFIVNYLGK